MLGFQYSSARRPLFVSVSMAEQFGRVAAKRAARSRPHTNLHEQLFSALFLCLCLMGALCIFFTGVKRAVEYRCLFTWRIDAHVWRRCTARDFDLIQICMSNFFSALFLCICLMGTLCLIVKQCSAQSLVCVCEHYGTIRARSGDARRAISTSYKSA